MKNQEGALDCQSPTHQSITAALDFRALMVAWITATAQELDTTDLVSLETTRVLADQILAPDKAEQLLAHEKHGPKIIQVAGKIAASHALKAGDLVASMRAAALILAALPLGGPQATEIVADATIMEAAAKALGEI
jgi:hypothetical protein